MVYGWEAILSNTLKGLWKFLKPIWSSLHHNIAVSLARRQGNTFISPFRAQECA